MRRRRDVVGHEIFRIQLGHNRRQQLVRANLACKDRGVSGYLRAAGASPTPCMLPNACTGAVWRDDEHVDVAGVGLAADVAAGRLCVQARG